jgi:thiamine-phosphate pyrophosphorylase
MSVADEQSAVWRVIDASLNRATEGLRVLEDLARFRFGDRFLTGQLKAMRHQLGVAAGELDSSQLLASRDTEGDVGTSLPPPETQSRQVLDDIARANFARVRQALRSLEEFSKMVAPSLAGVCEQIRYASYTLEKACLRVAEARARLAAARLYILLQARLPEAEFVSLARELCAAGADVLQLREKQMDDRALLARARLLRGITAETGCLFIMNDRPDLAVLAEADGVHVGQEELGVADVRRIVGPHRLVGVSTHHLDQARQAVRDGADYLGCGPVFPSATKTFTEFPGLDYLRQAAAAIELPWFAIGGIDGENLPRVLETGCTRVAVSRVVGKASQPGDTVRHLRRLLLQ